MLDHTYLYKYGVLFHASPHLFLLLVLLYLFLLVDARDHTYPWLLTLTFLLICHIKTISMLYICFSPRDTCYSRPFSPGPGRVLLSLFPARPILVLLSLFTTAFLSISYSYLGFHVIIIIDRSLANRNELDLSIKACPHRDLLTSISLPARPTPIARALTWTTPD